MASGREIYAAAEIGLILGNPGRDCCYWLAWTAKISTEYFVRADSSVRTNR